MITIGGRTHQEAASSLIFRFLASPASVSTVSASGNPPDPLALRFTGAVFFWSFFLTMTPGNAFFCVLPFFGTGFIDSFSPADGADEDVEAVGGEIGGSGAGPCRALTALQGDDVFSSNN